MFNGLLCDVCQLRIPIGTVSCDIEARRPGSEAARVLLRNIDVCIVCIDGEMVHHKKLSIKVAKVRKFCKHTDPITKV